jgi:hypothetical protein
MVRATHFMVRRMAQNQRRWVSQMVNSALRSDAPGHSTVPILAPALATASHLASPSLGFVTNTTNAGGSIRSGRSFANIDNFTSAAPGSVGSVAGGKSNVNSSSNTLCGRSFQSRSFSAGSTMTKPPEAPILPEEKKLAES